MRQNTFIFITLYILFTVSNFSIAQDATVNTIEMQNKKFSKAQLDLIEKHSNVFPNNTQLSIAIIQDSVVQFYGVKLTNDTLKLINNHQSVFEIGSVSKVFTSALLAEYVVNKQINLDGDISKNLDYKLGTDAIISWQNLANHTAGFPRLPSNLNLFTMDMQNPYKDYGETELIEYLTGKIELLHAPGEKYAYSNLGAGLLAYLLASKFDGTYQSLLQQHIFSKYEMKHSTTSRTQVADQLIAGQDATGKTTANWDLNVLQGAGAILSTVEDLSKFALAHFNESNKALALSRKSTFTVNENMDLGLGWHVLKNQGVNNWYWHNGGTGGYTSSFTIDPTAKNGVIILSNVSAFHSKMGNIDQLCFALMNTLEE